MFQRVHAAYVMADLADLEHLRDDDRAKLEQLVAATDLALSAGALALVMRNQMSLSDGFLDAGYERMSLYWTRQALETLGGLLKQETDSLAREKLHKDQYKLSERAAQLLLKLSGSEKQAPYSRPRSPKSS